MKPFSVVAAGTVETWAGTHHDVTFQELGRLDGYVDPALVFWANVALGQIRRSVTMPPQHLTGKVTPQVRPQRSHEASYVAQESKY